MMLHLPQIACSVYRTISRSVLFKFHSKTSQRIKVRNMSTRTNVQARRPLVIFLPWLGAAPRASDKYVNMYRKLGFDVLVQQPRPTDILWPLAGLKGSRQFLLEIQAELNSEKRPIIVHCISVGGYYYALMLILLNAEPEAFQNILSNIRGQVVDSPVLGTANEMAIGVSQMASQNRAVQKMIQFLIPLYYAATSPYTAKYYDKSMETIKLHPPIVPSLVMSSDNDPMILPQSLESHKTAWTNIGIDNTLHMWENSEHAQHYKNHPTEYENMIQSFVEKVLSQNQ